MTNDYLATPEEEAFGHLMKVNEELLSKAARTIVEEAGSASYAHTLASNYAFQPEEYEEAMRKMRLAAAKLTTQDRDLLAEIVRAAKAAVSIDPDDETPAGYGARRGDVHYHHSMAASMVEEILQEARE